MKINPVQAALAALAILTSAALAEVLRPHELMASSSKAPDLESAIPRQFGEWTLVPNVGLVTPTGPAGFARQDLSAKIYSQEIARGYADRAGNIVMFLVAYGPT